MQRRLFFILTFRLPQQREPKIYTRASPVQRGRVLLTNLKPPLCKGRWVLRSKTRRDCLSNTFDLRITRNNSKTIPHPLRGSSLCWGEPFCLLLHDKSLYYPSSIQEHLLQYPFTASFHISASAWNCSLPK